MTDIDITERLRHFCTDWDGSQMDDHTEPMPGLHCIELRDAAAEIDRLRAQVAEMREDAERLNWLATQYVVVRTPLRYGSRESFSGSPWDVEDSSPWDIRAAIDRARKSGPEGAA